ncbi:MAG: feruloyl-CoA synthase [Acidobacteriaceae bacterium]|nr:feruloyl-CoA synthase [Acidobacteriaceae bacterium]
MQSVFEQEAPIAALHLAQPNILREDRPDGSFVLRSAEPLLAYERNILEWLVYWAAVHPERTFLAERIRSKAEPAWRRIKYSEALASVRAIGQALLKSSSDPQGPVVVLSSNSIRHALLSLGAMMVGRVFASVSPAYSLRAKKSDKLRRILQRLGPSLVYVEDGDEFRSAINGVSLTCPMVTTQNHLSYSIPFDSLLEEVPTREVDLAFSLVTPHTPAKYLLTSGSTGNPKAVINTHGMLSVNQRMIAQCWRFVDRAAPIVVDWLPWSHTFGANHNFNLVLRNGGTLYLDDGGVVRDRVERTVENIKDVKPTLYFNVPEGFRMLLPYLRKDPEFVKALFVRLEMMFYAAASLPPPILREFEEAARQTRSSPVFFTTEWGATETAPVVTSVGLRSFAAGNIGTPVPGVDLKFVPTRGKFEMRVRGPNVFPGYYNDEEATANAFDAEGFYRTGDAGKLADPAYPEAGILFDGRVAEDFKLSTGTWVSVGTVRLRMQAALGIYAQNVVVAGHNRAEVGILIFPSPTLLEFAREADDLSGPALALVPEVRRVILAALESAAEDAGSSQHARRAVLLSSPPSFEAGEITDKAYINQGVVLAERAWDVDRLFSASPSVIQLGNAADPE